MNVFFIPSWYPDEENYVQGIFIKEQFESMAELYPDSQFVISNVLNYNLPVKHPAVALKSVNKFSRKKNIEIKSLKENLFEISNPVLTWTEKLKGNITRQLKVHEENYLYAQKKLGSIDLIHAHVSFPAGYIAMKLKEKFKVPFIITEHMGPFPFEQFISDGKLTPEINDPLNHADKIIAVSSTLASSIESYINKKHGVIPNMVNETIFKPAVTIADKKRIVFLTVSALIESKGIIELLDAAKIAIKQNDNIEFRIIGKGDLENNVREFIDQNNLQKKITLRNNLTRKEVIKEFQDCDAYILTSRHESFGVSYVEAMACGKPVIATRCGGPTDFVNSENGILVDIGDVNEIADAILTLASKLSSYDPVKIRDFFMKNYSRSVVCSQIYRAYESVVDAR